MKRLAVVLLAAVAALWALPASAGSVSATIVGNSNGPACSDGGSFSQTSIAAKAGDNVAITVQINDTYRPAGWKVNGFPEGSVLIASGTSHTFSFQAISSFTFNGVGSVDTCHLADAQVVVSASPAPPPPPASVKPPPPPPPPPAATTTDQSSSSDSTSDNATSTSSDGSPLLGGDKAQQATNPKPGSKTALVVAGASGVVLLGLAGWLFWFFLQPKPEAPVAGRVVGSPRTLVIPPAQPDSGTVKPEPSADSADPKA